MKLPARPLLQAQWQRRARCRSAQPHEQLAGSPALTLGMTRSGLAGFCMTAAFLLVGLALFFLTQRMAQLCIGDFGCASKPELIVRLFGLGVGYWLLPAAGVLLMTALLAGRVTACASIAITASLGIVLIVWIAHVLDLLLGQLFCHEWGCSFLLPTWTLFER
jgi:hypothetical protein